MEKIESLMSNLSLQQNKWDIMKAEIEAEIYNYWVDHTKTIGKNGFGKYNHYVVTIIDPHIPGHPSEYCEYCNAKDSVCQEHQEFLTAEEISNRAVKITISHIGYRN